MHYLSCLPIFLSYSFLRLKNFFNFLGLDNALIPAQNVSLKTQVTGDMKKMEIKQFTFNIGTKNAFTFSGSGTLTKILTDPTLNFSFKTQLSDEKLSDLWSIQPMSITGDLNLSSSHLVAKEIIVDANRSDVNLSMNVQKVNQSYNAKINFVSDLIVNTSQVMPVSTSIF